MRFLLFSLSLFFLTVGTQLDCDAASFAKVNPAQITGDVKQFYNVGVRLFTVPLRFQYNDWKNIGLITGGTVALFFVDKDIKHFAQTHRNAANNRLFNMDHYYGNSYTAAMTIGIYGFGLLFNQSSVRQAGLRSMEAFFYSGLITGALKELFGRRRPYGGNNQLIFKPFHFSDTYQSLPSGHSTVSFAVSTIMAKSLDNIFWKSFWYGSAGMVAASRIYHNAHWFSDVFLGGIIGYSVARFIVKSDENITTQSNNFRRGKYLPYFSAQGIGISVLF